MYKSVMNSYRESNAKSVQKHLKIQLRMVGTRVEKIRRVEGIVMSIQKLRRKYKLVLKEIDNRWAQSYLNFRRKHDVLFFMQCSPPMFK